MRRLVLLPALVAFLVGAVPALAWTWPVDGPVLQSFSLEGGPYAAGQHRGIDVAADEGVPVRAPAAGTVTFAGTVPDGGRSVTIETSDGLAVTLLHLGAVLVAEGDVVAEGADVGVAGWSGEAEHPVASVHLGVRVAADATGYLDPLLYLPSPTTSGQAVAGGPGAPAVPPAAEDGEETPANTGSTPAPLPDGGAAAPDAGTDAVGVGTVAPIDAGVAPLEPLSIVSGETLAPPAASAPPAHAASPDSSGRSPDASPAGTEGVPAAPSAPESSTPSPSSKRSRPAEPARLAEARSPETTREGRDDERSRQRRPRPVVSTTTVELAGRSVPAVGPSRSHDARRAGLVDGEGARPVRDLRKFARLAVPMGARGGNEWLWRTSLTAILAISVVALVARRRRGGGPACPDTDLPPCVPPAVPAPAVERTDG